MSLASVISRYPALTLRSSTSIVSIVTNSKCSTVSVRGLPVVIDECGSTFNPNAAIASKLPPVIVPPVISIVPSLFKFAYKPALVISSKSIPSVVVWFIVIVDNSLLEFFIITVCPFVILIPSPSSDKSVSDVAVVTCVMIVSCDKFPDVCEFE